MTALVAQPRRQLGKHHTEDVFCAQQGNIRSLEILAFSTLHVYEPSFDPTNVGLYCLPISIQVRIEFNVFLEETLLLLSMIAPTDWAGMLLSTSCRCDMTLFKRGNHWGIEGVLAWLECNESRGNMLFGRKLFLC